MKRCALALLLRFIPAPAGNAVKLSILP